MIQVVFTTSDTFVGRAIKYLTGEEMTHVGLYQNKKFLHSSLAGVEIATRKEFTAVREIVGTVDVKTDKSLEEIAAKFGSRGYDYKALVWLGARYFLKKFCGIDIPKVNLWNITGMYTCTELVTEILDGEADSLITPYQLYERLNNG